MNLEHVQLATVAVVNLVNEMKSEAEKLGYEVTSKGDGLRILFPGFNGGQSYSFLRLSRMALISVVTKCPFKIKTDERYGPKMLPEVDLSKYEGEFPSTVKMFNTVNKELREFLDAQSDLSPAHIFWSRPAAPDLNASADDREVFAVLGNVYEDGRFRNLSLTLNHFSYIYLTDNVKYKVIEHPELGNYIDLHEDSDKAYGELCWEVYTRVKNELRPA